MIKLTREATQTSATRIASAAERLHRTRRLFNGTRCLPVVAALVCCVAADAAAQNTQSVADSCRSVPPTPKSVDLPQFEMRRLTVPDADTLKRFLRCRWFRQAMQLYFRVYQKELLDWVVYVDKQGVVRQGLTEATSGASEVSEEKYVWAVVFSDDSLVSASLEHDAPNVSGTTPAATAVSVVDGSVQVASSFGPQKADNGAPPDTADFLLSRRVIVNAPGAALSQLIGVLGKAVGLSPAAPATLNDSSRVLKLTNDSVDASRPFYAGFARLGLVENAQVELSLAPVAGKRFAMDSARSPNANPQVTCDSASPCPLQRMYTNMANMKRHTFEAGLLVGLAYGGKTPTFSSAGQPQGLTARTQFNGYLEASWNAIWFRWALDRPGCQEAAIGPFFGTNIIRGSFGDDIVGGLMVSHLIRDAGRSAGIDLSSAQRIRSGVLQSYRQRRFLLAIDARL